MKFQAVRYDLANATSPSQSDATFPTPQIRKGLSALLERRLAVDADNYNSEILIMTSGGIVKAQVQLRTA